MSWVSNTGIQPCVDSAVYTGIPKIHLFQKSTLVFWMSSVRLTYIGKLICICICTVTDFRCTYSCKLKRGGGGR